MTEKKAKRPQQVFTLLVEVGRSADDDLQTAGLHPLDVSGYGTLEERLADGHDISDEERGLMDRALAENAVIVAQMTPFFEEETPNGPH